MRIDRHTVLRITRAAALGPMFLAGCGSGMNVQQSQPSLERPNFIIILTDNMGYGDLGCYGSELNRTPRVDQLAREGLRLTSFYSSSGVCTPSRASLMTGCYAQRVNMHVSDKNGWVLRPVAAKGLNPNEVTIAEVLKQQDYVTACIGKWHLGDQPEFLPTRQGFDSFLGIPYSEDMYPRPDRDWPPVPLLRDEQVVEAPADLASTTRRYVEEAIRFLRENRDHPFFLYFPHHLPGSMREPVVDPRFGGQSANGPWGDSMEEIDWSVGEILDTLEQLEIEDRTLVVFVSDNGAPLGYGGSNGILGGAGYTTSEGGMRVPCIIRWPGRVPAGKTCAELCTIMDILPTFARLAECKPPQDRIIDGKDVWSLWAGLEGEKSPHEVFYYYMVNQLQAVQDGRWKLNLELETQVGGSGERDQKRPSSLIDLSQDLREENDVSAQHPEVVQKLLGFATKAREDLGDLGHTGIGQRPAGWVENPRPLVLVE